jgi:transcription factor SPN1
MVEDAECDNIVMNLIDKMRDAYDKDKASNLEKKPAFERLKLLNNIDITLQRVDVREIFLEKDGCHELTEWLKRMPDETYPN